MSNFKESLDHRGSYGIQTSLTPADSNPGDLGAGGSLGQSLDTGQPGPTLLVLLLQEGWGHVNPGSPGCSSLQGGAQDPKRNRKGREQEKSSAGCNYQRAAKATATLAIKQ